MFVAVGMGHWVLALLGSVVDVDVALQGTQVVVVVGGLPPLGGFLPKQSFLEYLPPLGTLPQYDLISEHQLAYSKQSMADGQPALEKQSATWSLQREWPSSQVG